MALPPSPNSNGDSGCFSAILHCLLCRNGVPTHPSSLDLDHASPLPHSKNKTKTLVLANESYNNKAASSPAPLPVTSSVEKPGIVARLMGLETLPDFTKRRVDPSTVPRSRSVNFMDYLITGVEAEHTTVHQHHRRVRTSVSFREVVVPRQQSKQDDLLVLYLDELAAAESFSLGANSSSSSTSNNGSKNVVSERAGKEFNKQKKDSKLRDQKSNGRGVTVIGAKKEKVVNSKLRKEPVVRGKQNSSIRVKDGGRGNYKVESEYNNGKKKDTCKQQRAAGRMIQQKEVVAESNYITKKKKQKRSAGDSKEVLVKRLEEIKNDDIWESLTSLDDHQLDHHGYYSSQGNSTPEDIMKSYDRNLSSISWRDKLCTSPPKAETGQGLERKERRNSEKLDTRETQNYDSVAAALDHVCRLTEEDIINKEEAFQLSSSELYREEMCVMIEHRILNIILEQLVGDLLRTT